MAWLEASLSCLIFSKNVLTDPQIEKINASESEPRRWVNLINFLIRLQYLGGKQKDLTRVNLGVTTHARYKALVDVIEKKIQPFIELRHRLAHGQWHIALTNDGTKKNPDLTSTVWTLSKRELLLLRVITKNTVRIVGQLIVGTTAFEKDFDEVMIKIDQADHELERRYQESLAALRRAVKFKKEHGLPIR